MNPQDARARAGILTGVTVLVVAHDFPPVRSPQSIRGLHLVQALCAEGASVDVVTRSEPRGASRGDADLCQALPGLRVYRASSGHLESAIDWVGSLRRAVQKPNETGSESDHSVEPPAGPVQLNWKGRLIRHVRRLHDRLRFPDGRAAWAGHAAALIKPLLKTERPHVALILHEPAAGLLLHKLLSDAGVPWMADLADPVLAPYTAAHWRGRASKLEATVLRGASALSVTNEATAQLLGARHGVPADRFLVLPQGFTPSQASLPQRGETLRLVYTGRLYPFRNADALLSAVRSIDHVELLFAGPELPESVIAAAASDPVRFKVLGGTSHATALALQREADVLVSIGNKGTAQTPGKVIEYFGSARPILHVAHDADDRMALLVRRIHRGVACAADVDEIISVLSALLAHKQAGTLGAAFDLSFDQVVEYEWSAIGGRLAGHLASIQLPRWDKA